MNEELKAIEKNDTWEPADLLEGQEAISTKWVYTIKRKADGSILRKKARFVARQTPGIDIGETFVPIARWETVRGLVAIAAHNRWELSHMDVKTAFLHGELEEEVYIQIPEGYHPAGGDNQVLRLKKALYGLCQAPRAWYQKVDTYLLQQGFKRGTADTNL